MEEQEAVNVPAEQTAPVESAPIETEATDTSSTQVEESSQSKKVSESVPYERFKEVNDRLKQLEERFNQPQAQTPTAEEFAPVGAMANDMPFDQDTAQALDQWYEQRRENERAQEFVSKHADDLKDPFIAARTQQIIREANMQGKKASQEKALAQAKKELETRFAPIRTEAKAEGEKEGVQVAQNKEKLGAIGSTASKQEVDESKLTAKEYAERYGMKRV